MKMSRSKCALLSFALVCGSQQVFAGALDDLSPEDKQKVVAALAAGQTPISIRVPVDGSLWPEFRVFEKVYATPEEAMAIFSDFENDKTFFNKQGITKSDIVSGKGASTQVISYHLSQPLASDDYTCEDHLSANLSANTYEVDWDVTESGASVAKSPDAKVWSNGTAVFEPYEDGTLIAYRSRVVPKERMGVTWGWVINKAEDIVKDTVDALTKQIQNEKATDTTTLQNQIQNLRTALATSS